jgi:hypothetical protein
LNKDDIRPAVDFFDDLRLLRCLYRSSHVERRYHPAPSKATGDLRRIASSHMGRIVRTKVRLELDWAAFTVVLRFLFADDTLGIRLVISRKERQIRRQQVLQPAILVGRNTPRIFRRFEHSPDLARRHCDPANYRRRGCKLSCLDAPRNPHRPGGRSRRGLPPGDRIPRWGTAVPSCDIIERLS